MARSVSWLPRLHEIRRAVEGAARSHYTRREIEILFKLQPRAAGQLVEMLAEDKMGRNHLVKRETLAKFLADAAEAEDVRAVIAKQRDARPAISRMKIRSMSRRDFEALSPLALPDWIELAPGRLLMRFETMRQLGEGLFLIARCLDGDAELDRFAQLYEPRREPSAEKLAQREDVAAMMRELESLTKDPEEAQRC